MDTPPALPVLLPLYEAELEAKQRAALRTAMRIAAVLLVAFTLLDRATAPSAWLTLLAVRVGAAAALSGVARATRERISPIVLAGCAMAVIAGTIEVAVFETGGARSPYLTGNIALFAGAGLLIPFTALQAVVTQLVGLAVALVPLFFRLQPGDALPLAIAASYLVTIAVVAIAGAHLHDTLRRREHRARLEVARQLGLVNLGTLAGGLAHELASPLTFVSLELELLETGPLDPSVRERVRAARSGILRMGNILTAMRQGARLSTGELREVQLARELDLAVTLLAPRLRGSGVEVVREYATDVPPVSCQPTLLGQLLVNLLINALDAMKGRPDARLTLRVRPRGAGAEVEIEDTGPGIAEDLRQRIFEPFFTTKGEQGNGLGLWISSEIARAHAGELVALPGARGALFRLLLPAQAEQASSAA